MIGELLLRRFPLKGQKLGDAQGILIGNSYCVGFLRKGKKPGIDWEKRRVECPLKEQKSEKMQGILVGNSGCVGCPLKEKNDGDSCGRNDWVKWAEKLRKLSFLKLEIMRKMDISRQA